MTNLLKLLSIVSLFLGVQAANAGILVEPYLGTATLAVKITVAGVEGASETGSASISGLKLGWGMLGLHAGLDYQMATSDGATAKYTGILASYKFPILVKGYVVKYIKATADDGSDMSDGLNYTKFGIGFTGLPFVHLNLEYSSNSYTMSSILGEVKGTSTTIGLVASMPFDF